VKNAKASDDKMRKRLNTQIDWKRSTDRPSGPVEATGRRTHAHRESRHIPLARDVASMRLWCIGMRERSTPLAPGRVEGDDPAFAAPGAVASRVSPQQFPSMPILVIGKVARLRLAKADIEIEAVDPLW
jgi:hypothetical protein